MTSTTATTGSAPSVATPAARSPLRIAGYVGAALLALIPVVRMAQLVLDGSRLPYADYWEMLDHFAYPDGSLHVAGLFEFQNHPVVIAQFVYWLNMQLFGGSNIVLGLFDLALVLVLLGVIGLVLHQTAANLWARLAVFVMASCLLFSPNGAWNFVKAMSGTAWFTANLFAVVAVLLRSKDRPVLAFAASVLTAISYGTGLMVWPAVIAVGLVRRPPREWWRELPYAAGFVVTYAWYRSAAQGPGVELPGVATALATTAELLAQPLGLTGTPAKVVGAALMVAIVALVIWCIARVRTPSAGAWVGIASFGLLAAIELALGRQSVLESLGAQNRYTSIPALAWIGFAGLVLTVSAPLAARLGDRRPGAAPALLAGGTAAAFLLVGVLATTSGAEHVAAMRASRVDQEVGATALRLGVADGTAYLVGPFATGLYTPRPVLEATGNYPYDGSWDADCGLLDQTVDPVDPTDDQPIGSVRSARKVFLLHNAAEISGSIDTDRPIRCVLVLDRDDRVVGAGAVDREATTDGRRFTALGRPGSAPYEVVVVFDDADAPVRLGTGPITPGS